MFFHLFSNLTPNGVSPVTNLRYFTINSKRQGDREKVFREIGSLPLIPYIHGFQLFNNGYIGRCPIVLVKFADGYPFGVYVSGWTILKAYRTINCPFT